MRYSSARQRAVFLHAVALLLLFAPRAFAGGTSYSGTTASAQYVNFSSACRTTTVAVSGVQTPSANNYSAFNIAAPYGSANGTPYSKTGSPDGTLYSGGLVETGTGLGGTASVTFLGATAGETAAQSTNLPTNTWIKGTNESAGYWNVSTNSTNMLGGFTNNAGQIGSVTLTLGADYTAWGTLIGTNTGASLDVTIAGYENGTQIWTYDYNGIKQSTLPTKVPDFTGYVGTTKFNQVVITGKTSSTTNQNATYGYPNAAFIALDQTRVGSNAALPEPGTLSCLLLGGLCVFEVVARRRQTPAQDCVAAER